MPKINNRSSGRDTKFVVFVESISVYLGIQSHHLIDYYDTYRSYKKALRSGLTYEKWCEKRAKAKEERRAELEKKSENRLINGG